MDKYTFLAIRRPEELKGVYSGKENIRKIRSKIYGIKGVSSRVFGENQEEEALKWAEVKNISNDLQEDINKDDDIQNNSTREENKDNVNIEQIISKCILAINEQQKENISKKELSDIEIMIKKYENDKYPCVNLVLTTDKIITIQIRDIYYYSNSNDSNFNIRKGDLDSNINCMFYTTDYNDDTNKTQKVFNENLFNNELKYIKKLKKTKITYLNNGIAIENYDDRRGLVIEQYNAYHRGKNLYIPFSSIVYIKPVGYWCDLKTKITDEFIIQKCNKLVK